MVERRARLALLVAFGLSSVANYSFSLLMARWLLPGDFGTLAFCQTLLLVAGLVLESGIPWTLARQLTQPEAQRAALTRGALRLNVGLAGLLAALVVALFAAGPLRPGLEHWSLALLVALALPPIALVGVARGAAQGLERFAALAAVQAAEVLGKALLGGALVLLGGGVTGAVGGFTAGALLACLLGYALLPRISPCGPAHRLPGVGPMFAGLLGGALLFNTHLLVFKLLSPDRAAVGIYQAALVLSAAPYYLSAAVLVPLTFSSLARCASPGATLIQLGRVLGLAVATLVPLELGLAALPHAALGLLFPAGYGAGAPSLRLLALGSVPFLLATLLATAFQATGQSRVVARTFLGVLAAGTLALALTVPRFGATGAAACFGASALLACAVLAGLYLPHLRGVRWQPGAFWLARWLGALGVGGLTLRALLQSGAAPLLAAALAAATYLMLAYILRVLPGRQGRHPPSVALGDS